MGQGACLHETFLRFKQIGPHRREPSPATFHAGLFRSRSATFSGVLGYKALYVDYAQGEGRRRYESDMLQLGPVVGISMRF